MSVRNASKYLSVRNTSKDVSVCIQRFVCKNVSTDVLERNTTKDESVRNASKDVFVMNAYRYIICVHVCL